MTHYEINEKLLNIPKNENENDYIEIYSNMENHDDTIISDDIRFIVELIKYFDTYGSVNLLDEEDNFNKFQSIVDKTNGKILENLSSIYKDYHRFKKKENNQTPIMAEEFSIQVGSALSEAQKIRLGQIKNVGKKVGTHAVVPFGTGLKKGFLAESKKKAALKNPQISNTKNKSGTKTPTKKNLAYHSGKVLGIGSQAALSHIKDQVVKKRNASKSQDNHVMSYTPQESTINWNELTANWKE